MKPILGLILILAPLAAQEAAAPAAVQEVQTAAPAQDQQPTTDQPAAAEAERPVTGTVDFGYRWISGPKGDFNTYRSVVNLGEGPKVFNFDFTIDDPSRHFWHNLTVIGSGWGGDPYNTLKVIAEKQRYYRFTADYRNIAYYDFLPSFASPVAVGGVPFNERSYDTKKRTTDINLELFPTRRIVPFFAYGRGSNYGDGITPFNTGPTNEYPIRSLIDDHVDNYRGGVRFEFDKLHLTLEQGGTRFADNQQAYSTEASTGDRTTPIFGQQLSLTSALQGYGVTGDSIYTKVLLNSNVLKWVNISGQFLYS